MQCLWSKVEGEIYRTNYYLSLDKASGSLTPKWFPELHPCIVVVVMMSVSVITETAQAHSHVLFASSLLAHCSTSEAAF